MTEGESLEEKIRKVVGPRKFNDRILKDGFPDGWFVQDRLDENVALLIRPVPGSWLGSVCLCLRPKAITTDDWLPTAREIAHSVAAMSSFHDGPSKALVDVAAERRRLVEEDEYASRNSDLVPPGTLALAGAVHALPNAEANSIHGSGAKLWRVLWPFEVLPQWKDDRERLVTAAALILGEIEEMDRVAALGSADEMGEDSE